MNELKKIYIFHDWNSRRYLGRESIIQTIPDAANFDEYVWIVWVGKLE